MGRGFNSRRLHASLFELRVAQPRLTAKRARRSSKSEAGLSLIKEPLSRRWSKAQRPSGPDITAVSLFEPRLSSSERSREVELVFYVYIIRGVGDPSRTYIGFTGDLKQRIATHNPGGSTHTAKFAPWRLVFYAAFKEKLTALDFESYLKSHSGKAFAGKRLIPAQPVPRGCQREPVVSSGE